MATNDGYEDFGTTQRGPSLGVATGGVPFWGDFPETYDSVVLAGRRLPGLCSIKGKGYEMRRHHGKAAGKHGVTTTVIAHEPAEFVIHVMMTTEDNLREFEGLVPVFKPAAKPRAGKSNGNSDAYTHAFSGQASKAADGTVTLPSLIIRPDPNKTSVAPDGTIILPTMNFVLKDDSQPRHHSISHPMLALFRISYCTVLLVTIPEQVEDKGMWKSELHCIEYVLEGSRAATTGKMKTASDILSIPTAKDKLLGRKPTSPSQSNVGPPK